MLVRAWDLQWAKDSPWSLHRQGKIISGIVTLNFTACFWALYFCAGKNSSFLSSAFPSVDLHLSGDWVGIWTSPSCRSYLEDPNSNNFFLSCVNLGGLNSFHNAGKVKKTHSPLFELLWSLYNEDYFCTTRGI